MTVAELYRSDVTLRGLFAEWTAHRRAPVPLIDRLMELDASPTAVCCARWLVACPDREVYAYESQPKGDPGAPPQCGPFPRCSSPDMWYWCVMHYTNQLKHANELRLHWVLVARPEPGPVGVLPMECTQSLPESQVAIFDAWVLTKVPKLLKQE